MNVSATDNARGWVVLSIVEIRSFIIPSIAKYPIGKVILFGSHVHGDATNTGGQEYQIRYPQSTH